MLRIWLKPGKRKQTTTPFFNFQNCTYKFSTSKLCLWAPYTDKYFGFCLQNLNENCNSIVTYDLAIILNIQQINELGKRKKQDELTNI